MTSIGNSVYCVSGVDLLSFGIVTNEKTVNDWKWYQVKWNKNIPDNSYMKKNMNIETGWFRCDTIRCFEPNQMIEEINMGM
jgi:hypothetical protein